jgi:hypothetical protein
MKTRLLPQKGRGGMSFIEISMATIILALALLPVFGLIQGGLVRSDVSASYSAATELATALMNKLLSDTVKFADIPASAAGSYLTPAGSVAAETSLAALFDEPGWEAEDKAMARTKDNIRYKVELWVGNMAADADLVFHYLVNPEVDYQQARAPETRYGLFDNVLVLPDYEYSPYNPANGHLDANNPGSAWSTRVTTLNQWEVASKLNPVPHDANNNFKKLVLRVSWSGKPTGRSGLGDATKEFFLISFRANLEGE